MDSRVGWAVVMMMAVGTSCSRKGTDSSQAACLNLLETQERATQAAMSAELLNASNWNGIRLNASNWNGREVNGSVVAVSLRGAQLGSAAGGACASSLSVDGNDLGALADGRTVRGAALAGTELVAVRSDRGTVRLRIESVEGGDLSKYTVSQLVGSEWQPLCGIDDKGTPVQALVLAGRWDYRQGVANAGGKIVDPAAFTFACRGFVLAKCLEWGYSAGPASGGVSREDLHAACVRAVRADYCGDGRSWTEDGTQINVYDTAQIQRDTEDWPVEAEWDTHGARCAVPGNFRKHVPDCQPRLVSASCGDKTHFAAGTLLMTEVPKAGAKE